MKEYVAIEEAGRLDAAELGSWLARAFAYAASLPPREPRPRKRATRRT
jgi:hypothetical protein